MVGSGSSLERRRPQQIARERARGDAHRWPCRRPRRTCGAPPCGTHPPAWRSRFRTPASRVYCTGQLLARRSSTIRMLIVARRPCARRSASESGSALAISHLLFGRVAGESGSPPCDRAAVPGIGSSMVRRRDEEHLREIEGDVQEVVAEAVEFCSGSSTSSSAAAGSPRKSAPSLSISSSMITGLVVPGLLHRPG